MQEVEDVPIGERQHIHKIIGYDCDDTAYARVPVDSFGLGLLYEMGWFEGRGVGRNPDNAIHHVVEIQPRHHRQGLSADQKPVDKNGNLKEPEDLEKLLVPKRHRNKTLNSKVKITQGVHKGLKGIIMGLKGKTQLLVELENSEENVKLLLSDVEEDDAENETKEKLEKISKKVKKEKTKKDSKKKDKTKSTKNLTWIVPGIMVRIISKNFKNGKYYNSKVEVSEKIGSSRFQVLTEKMDFLDNLKESYVETLIPKIEKEVIFVKGDHKGQGGILKEKDVKKGVAFVQLLDDFSIINVSLDSISEKGQRFN